MKCGMYDKGRPKANKGSASKAKAMNKAKRVTGKAKAKK